MPPYWDNGISSLYQGDAREIPLGDGSVHCIVTSPPYWGLRKYLTDDARCIGNEATIADYVQHLTEVGRELWRVLRDDGICWLNLGDTYSGRGKGGPWDVDRSSRSPRRQRHAEHDDQASRGDSIEVPQGNLCGIPWRVAFALQAQGWILRQDIIWAKSSAMPESVNGWRWERCRVQVKKAALRQRDGLNPCPGGPISEANEAEWADCPGCPKCEPNSGLVLRRGSWRSTNSHDYIFMLAKQMGYFADREGVVQPAQPGTEGRYDFPLGGARNTYLRTTGKGRPRPEGVRVFPGSANRRSVWSDISPQCQTRGNNHYATFPPDLPRICIQASTSDVGACAQCGASWARVIEPSGWQPTCQCPDRQRVPATVLDPFVGSGTTCVAAQRLGRRSVGMDLSTAYLAEAIKRLETVSLPMVLP